MDPGQFYSGATARDGAVRLQALADWIEHKLIGASGKCLRNDELQPCGAKSATCNGVGCTHLKGRGPPMCLSMWEEIEAVGGEAGLGAYVRTSLLGSSRPGRQRRGLVVAIQMRERERRDKEVPYEEAGVSRLAA